MTHARGKGCDGFGLSEKSGSTSEAKWHTSWGGHPFHKGWFSPPVLLGNTQRCQEWGLSGVVELGDRSVLMVMWEWSGDMTNCTSSAWKPVVPSSGFVSGDWCNLFPHVVVSCGLLPECEISVLYAWPWFLLLLGTGVPSAEPSPALNLVTDAVMESNFRTSYAFLKLNIDLL